MLCILFCSRLHHKVTTRPLHDHHTTTTLPTYIIPLRSPPPDRHVHIMPIGRVAGSELGLTGRYGAVVFYYGADEYGFVCTIHESGYVAFQDGMVGSCIGRDILGQSSMGVRRYASRDNEVFMFEFSIVILLVTVVVVVVVVVIAIVICYVAPRSRSRSRSWIRVLSQLQIESRSKILVLHSWQTLLYCAG